MAKTRWDENFARTTRGRLVSLLRPGCRTVEEMAQALGITDNAVRGHLAALEKDGLVRQGGVRRGMGKPAFTYELTAEAERLFPKAYGLVLQRLLDELARRHDPAELEDLLQEVGRVLGAEHAGPEGDSRARLEAAVALLNELGGMAELEERDGQPVIRGFSCPFAALVPAHPQVCLLAQALLSEYTGLPLRECCQRGEHLRCSFHLDEL